MERPYLRDTLLVLSAEENGPGDAAGVLALEEEGFGLAVLETEDLAVTTDVEFTLFSPYQPPFCHPFSLQFLHPFPLFLDFQSSLLSPLSRPSAILTTGYFGGLPFQGKSSRRRKCLRRYACRRLRVVVGLMRSKSRSTLNEQLGKS